MKPTDDNPAVRLLFTGMVIFTYKDHEAQVVFHRKSHLHNLRVIVFAKAGGQCKEIFNSVASGIKIKKSLDVRIQQKSPDATFFQNGDPDDFNRNNWDDKDFRWLLDLEGPECYTHRLPRTNTKFSTILTVGNGTFYTYQHTDSTFTANVGTLTGKEFKVAKVIAADISLTGQECVSLLIDDQDVLKGHPLCNDAKYELYFLNECHWCTNDFPMVFDAVANGSSYKFDLKLKTKGINQSTSNLCLSLGTKATHQKSAGKKARDIKHQQATDEAPCMGSGFGSGGGFP